MDCKHRRRLRASGCKRCGLYRCPKCQEIRPWSNGGADSPACDECWMKANPRPAAVEPDKTTCDRCGADCSRGWSERWRGETAQTMTRVEVVCLACDLAERMAEYRKTGRLNNKVVLPAALYRQTCSYMTGGADGGWIEWMRSSDRADQRLRIAEEVKEKRDLYGSDYDKINAEVASLNDLVACFERDVWFGWLKAYYAGTDLRGHSARVGDLTMLVWGCAGRLMATLQRGDHSITLICDDSSDEHTMGVQGYDCTAEEGRALLADAVVDGGAALRTAIGPDNGVGIGL